MMQTIISMTAIFFAVLFPLYFLCRKDRASLPLSVAVAILSAAALEFFDLLAIIDPDGLLFWKKFTLVVEALLPPIWLWFSVTYARQKEPRLISLLQRLMLAASPLFACAVLVFPVSSFFYSPDFASEQLLFLGRVGFYFYLMLLVSLIIAVINLEMTLTSATLASRWKIKFELLGAGSLLAVMIFYYSQGLLFRTINMHLVPVRSIVILVAVVMMAYSRLKRGNGVKVYVSCQMAYKSVALLIVGIYLVGLGLAGEGMKYFGNGFQRSMIVALAFVAGLALIITLLSEKAKRRIRVFVHKNFYQNKYDYRNQWLQFTDRLSSAETGDDLLRSLVEGFCDTFGMVCGALFLLNHDREEYQVASSLGMEPVSAAFGSDDCAVKYLASRQWVVDRRNEQLESETEAQRHFFGANAIAFIIPLFVKAEMVGFIVLGRPVNSDETYNYEDYDLMKTLSRQASSALLNLRLSEQLARSREMAAMGKVSAFVMHDLKNLVSAMSLMLENAPEFINVPAFQKDLLGSLDSSVARMKTMIARLKKLPVKDSLNRSPVNLLQLAQETATLVNAGRFRVVGTPVIAEVDRDEIQKVALNLMLNALDATSDKQPVKVEVGEGASPFFRVTDEGCGMAEDFLRNDIFTPFKSTKKKGLGIGLYQSKQIVEAHGGKIEVLSEFAKGSEFTVWLPKANLLSL